ncbi:MAG: type VII secretion protein EccCa [Ktedonobacterales bacterium]|nr:type VII secretion protein EccCa [Ktedonobacterales bacterium]
MSTLAFHRGVRTYPERLPENEVAIIAPQPPPKPTSGGFLGILQYVLPALGGLTSIFFFISSPAKTSPLLLIGIGGMLLASVGAGVITRTVQNRQVKQQAYNYRQKYLSYLAGVTARLHDLSQRQQAANLRLYPSVATLSEVIASRTALWERSFQDADFLRVRVGVGVMPLSSQVKLDMGPNPLADFDTDLLMKAQAVASKYMQVDDTPITLNLTEHTVISVQGTPEQTRGLARAIIDDITTFHAPNDVRIAALFAPSQAAEWSWLKWLPHTQRLRPMRGDDFDGEEPMCLLASEPEDAMRLLQAQIAVEMERRQKLQELSEIRREAKRPHFVVLVDEFSPRNPLARLSALESWLRGSDGLGITIICLVRDSADESPTTQLRLAFNRGGWVSLGDTAYGGKRHEFITPDTADVATSERLARLLAPLTLYEDDSQAELAQDVRLLPLIGIPTVNGLNLRQSWQPRGRQNLLRVPIGMGADGAPLLLDIREAAEGGMGPHGLIIGATGSGKSELLRTIVTSLAITHDPATLNFILADFKGGASFADLAQLPHAAGMITNLQSDLSQVDRMRAALFGEQERRQRMLRSAGNLDNIRQYHQQRLTQPEMEPMPYLMIIVDEFAELLTQRPDFLELFVAIGRVGRSLGMHLLLATQRLSEGRIQGLEGHLRYRICLRTFSPSESSAVLGTPDAFYLPAIPGVGYFKVDTVYKQFKSALITTPVAAVDDNETPPVSRAFSALGRLTPLGDDGKNSFDDSALTEMDAVIAGIYRQYEPRNAVHQVWLPALDAHLTLRQVFDRLRVIQGGTVRRNGLEAPLGLLDIPAEQEQRPFAPQFKGATGHLVIVGAPQSGKSMALQSLMLSLMMTHSPQHLQIYAIDLGGGSLRVFEGAPHVGAICGTGERDAIRRLIRQMRSIIEAREILFREQRIDSMDAFRARRQAGDLMGTPFGDVFLLIDNYGQLRSDMEELEAEITDLAITGLTFGVHLVLTANRWSDLRAKLRDTIGARLELRLNDTNESEMGKAAAQSLMQMPAGRGIIKSGLQFQVGLPSMERDSEGGRGAIERAIAVLSRKWPGVHAPPLRLLPSHYLASSLPPAGKDTQGGVPIGIDEFQLDPVYVDLTKIGPHFIIFGDGESGKTNLLRLWINELARRHSPDEVRFALIDNRRTLLDVTDLPHLLSYACTAPMLKDTLETVRQAVEPRLLSNVSLSLDELRKPRQWQGPRYIVFVDDYETLVTNAGNPLTQWNAIIDQGKDVGFHLVIARRVGGAGRAFSDQVFQRLKEMGSPTMILSGDPQEGALVGTQKAAVLPPGRGFLVRRNYRTMLVQTALVEPAPVAR